MAEEISLNPKQLYFGLNPDSITSQLKPGQYPYSLNAVVEGWDGNTLTIQNEQGNVFCFDFPVGHQKNNYALKCGMLHRLVVNNTQTTLTEK